MRKLIILTLLLCGSVFYNPTYADPYILTGKDASNKIENAAVLRYNDRSTLPNYVEFESSHYLPEMRFNGWIKQFFKDGENVSFSQQQVITDKMGYTHRRYQEMINGIPVEFGIITTHSKGGMIKSISGELYPAVINSSTASLNIQNALQKALDHIGAEQYMWQVPGNEDFIKEEQNNPNATFKPEGKLVYIYKNNVVGKQFRLVYKFNVYAAKPLSRTMIWVDASTGAILYTDNIIKHVNSPGNGNTMYSGTRNITTDKVNASQYRLREANRAGGTSVRTYNMNHGTSYGSSTDFTNTNNTWTSGSWSSFNQNQAALDAHWGAEEVVDFYWIKFNRNSIDGLGLTVNGYVHYSNNFGNAFWDGYRMTYGDGGSQMNPVVSLDVTGHEMTHGVVQYTANFTGSTGETAGLNESFADIFGNTIEHFAKPTQANWWIGEDIVTSGGGIRYMANPKINGRPNTYQGQYWNAAGNGEPHFWGCPHDYCYYLMVQGGSGTNDNSDAYNITGIGWDEAINIQYTSLTQYLGPNTDYSDARFYAIQSATDLYGACSQEVITTTNAYYAIGVGNEYAGGAVISDFTASPKSGCAVPFTVTYTNTGSSGSGNTYNWDFGDGGTSTSENPTHTYTNFGSYNVQLTTTPTQQGCGADSKTENNFIDIQPTNSCASCDTINYPPPGTLTIYGTQNGGYLSGWNGYQDKAKANKFQNYGTYTNVSGAFIYFYGVHDGGSNAQVEINVWADNAGQPGNVIGTMTLSLQDLENALPLSGGTHQGIVKFTYPNSIPVTSPYYMGIKMVGFNASDSLGIVSNKEGDSPIDMMWELDVNDNWGTFAADWGSTTLDLFVAPIMTETVPQAVITANQMTICAGDSIKYDGTNSLNTEGYIWSFENGNISSSTDPIVYVTYNTPGTYQAILGVIGGCSGMGTDTVNITVTSGLTVNATATSTTICAGDQVTLSASGATTYSWDHGLGNGASKTVSPTATTTYTVTGSASGGCSATDQITVIVNSPPSVTATASNTTICAGDQVILSASGATTYSWDNGLGNGASKTVAPSTTKTYTVTGTTNGCSATDQITISVTTAPSVSATVSNATICAGDQVTLSASGATTYSWDHGLGNGASKTVSPTATTTYTVTGSASGGCSATDQITVIVNSLPSVSATASNTTICAGDQVTLSATGASTYSWDNGLGNGASKTVAPSTTKTYTVTGTTNGCSATDQITVTVTTTPIVSATVSNATICAGEQVTLSASGATSYSWNHGLGNGASKTVAPTSTTTYTVTGSGSGGCSATDQVTITVNPSSDASFAYSSNTICEGSGNVSPTITTTGGSFSTSNSGLVFANTATGEIDMTSSVVGTYTITYTISGTCGDTQQQTITITSSPDASFTYSNTAYCQDEGTTSPVFSGGGSAGTFSSTSGLTINANTGTINLGSSTPGTYTITNEIAASGTCLSATNTFIITVNATPNVSLAANNTTICSGESVILTASGATSYTWNQGLASGSSNTVSPTSDITYQVTGDQNGCTATDQISITVHQKPSLTVDQIVDPTTCNGQGSLTLSFTNLPDGSYTVYYDGGSFTNVNVSGGNATINAPNGSYNNLYVMNGTGCQSTDNPDVQLIAPNGVIANAGANSTAICSGEDIQLTANTISGVTYSWTGPNGFTSSDQNPNISNADGTASGSYYLTITNGSCSDTDHVVINVNPTPIVDAGNDFTVCDTFNPIQLTGSPTGGIFSGTGINNNIFDPILAGDGTFTIVYTYTDNNGCTDSSAMDILVKDCTASLSKEVMNSFIIYPNPASKYVNIEVNENNEIQEIRMLTTIGQEIQVSISKINHHIFQLDVSPLATGTYFIQVTTKNNRITEKIEVH